VKPVPGSPHSTWTWYVAAGSTREERRQRLAECPEEMRGVVAEAVTRLFRESQDARRK